MQKADSNVEEEEKEEAKAKEEEEEGAGNGAVQPWRLLLTALDHEGRVVSVVALSLSLLMPPLCWWWWRGSFFLPFWNKTVLFLSCLIGMNGL